MGKFVVTGASEVLQETRLRLLCLGDLVCFPMWFGELAVLQSTPVIYHPPLTVMESPSYSILLLSTYYKFEGEFSCHHTRWHTVGKKLHRSSFHLPFSPFVTHTSYYISDN